MAFNRFLKRAIPYSAQTYDRLTYNNPLFFIRKVHLKRFKDALSMLALNSSDVFLDYGCGDGKLLVLCSELPFPLEEISGFEPVEYMYNACSETLKYRSVRLVKDILI